MYLKDINEGEEYEADISREVGPLRSYKFVRVLMLDKRAAKTPGGAARYVHVREADSGKEHFLAAKRILRHGDQLGISNSINDEMKALGQQMKALTGTDITAGGVHGADKYPTLMHVRMTPEGAEKIVAALELFARVQGEPITTRWDISSASYRVSTPIADNPVEVQPLHAA